MNFSRLCLAAGLTLAVSAAAFAEGNGPGVARVSKPRRPAAAAQVQQTAFTDVTEQPVFDGTPFLNTSYHGGGNVFNRPPEGATFVIEDGACDCRKCRKFRKKHRGDCEEWDDCDDGHGHGCYGHGDGMLNYFACKFGCFIPTGHGGAGSPYFGHYARVYPQDVNHFDQRDGQLYSAQGYGIPIAVPLAPVVGHTYNYGWGVPSSRLTPISRMPGR
jgi:hypothetical protein